MAGLRASWLRTVTERRLLACLIVLVTALSLLLVACGDDDDDNDGGAGAPTETEGRADGSTDEPSETDGSPLETVTVQTDWVIHGGYSPLLYAVEAGYFEEEGLDVEINQGGPAAAGMETVNNGSTDFYYGALDEIPFDLAAGMNVKAVAAITHGNPNVLLIPGDSSIQTIADLEGKSVAFALGGGVANEVFGQMLQANGVDPSTVEMVEVDSDLVIPSVVSGQVDVGSGFRNSQFVAFQNEDPDARFITYTEHGFDWLGGYGIAVGEQMIQERPDTIRAFLRALLRAWADVDSDTAGAIEAATIHYPENFLDADFSERQLEQTLEMLEGPETATNGLGYMAEEEWQSLIDVSADYGGLEEIFPLETYYTNEFLPAEAIIR